jgi:transposase
MRSVGLDLGKKEVSYCEVGDGKVICRRTVGSLTDLEDLLGAEAPKAKVAIEACREAWHVYDKLRKNGHDVVIVDTTVVKRLGIGRHGRKNDRIDAELLARAVEEGRIPKAHVLSPHRRLLRQKLNARRTIVESRASFITSVRGIVRAAGEHLRLGDAEHFRETLAKTTLTSETRTAIGPLVVIIKTLDEQLSVVEGELETLAAEEPMIAMLTSVHGVNLIVAAVFVSVIDEAKRFASAHQVGSYIGLAPREHTSGGSENRKLGSITKCGNPYARAMLVQAAWCILRYRGKEKDPLTEWGRRVAARRGNRIAVVALARRLAGVLWAMWRDRTPYDPARLATASSRGLERAAISAERRAAAMRLIEKKATARRKCIDARTAAIKRSSASASIKEAAHI